MTNRASGIFLAAFVVLATTPHAGSAAGSVAVGGSLVLAVPARDGLVVAADRRGKLGDSGYCDSYHKIVEPSRPDRTVLAIAGGALRVAAPPSEVSDPCAYLREAPRYFDIGALARNHLETSVANVATMDTDQLAALCVETIATFQKAHPDDIRGPWDRPLFVVILASYAPAERRSIVKIFGVRLRANGEPFASDKKIHVLGPASASDLLAFGEADFLQEQVLKGPGKQFLGSGYKEWRKKTRIADVDRSLALAAAVDLIEATSKMVDLLPNRATIGGGVDAVLLGDQPRPQRLRGQAP
jgi:hypothetical protein